VIRQLIAWYVREPGAKLPHRPAEDEMTPPTQRPSSNRSAKVAAIREWAAEQRGEQGLPPAQGVSAEELIARALRLAPDGLTLADIRKALHRPREQTDEAIANVRRAPWVTETTETRPNAAGRKRQQVVLRLAEATG